MNKKIPEYVQAYVPDYEDLAILVTMAKGPDRKDKSDQRYPVQLLSGPRICGYDPSGS